MSTEKIRESFEAWHRLEYPGATLARRDNGEYFNLYVGMCWIGWQASRAAIEVELPPLSGMDSSFSADGIQKTREHNRYNAAVNDCRKAIKSLGLKIKQ